MHYSLPVSTTAARTVEEPLPRRRRRGTALLSAIYDAVLSELAENGYEGLSIERIAARSGTGKASIYRRWPNRLELVLEVLDHVVIPGLTDVPDTGSLRTDLLALLRRIARAMNDRSGCALRACVLDVGNHGELARAVRERLLPARKAALRAVIERGVARGEIHGEAITERIVGLGPTLLQGEVFQRGAVSDRRVVGIVDEVLLPLLRQQGS